MINYTKEQIIALRRVCEDLDIRVHDDYSGRFMFGDTCIAVSGDPNMISEMCDKLADEYYQPKMAREILGKWERDSLGFGIICYNK